MNKLIILGAASSETKFIPTFNPPEDDGGKARKSSGDYFDCSETGDGEVLVDPVCVPK